MLGQDGRHRCQAQVGCCCTGPRRRRAVQAPCKCAGALPACSAGHFARLGVFSSASERPWQRRGARRAPCKPCRRCRWRDRRLRACPLGPRSKKSKSKRLTLKQKYKVIRKVKEHHRKKRKEENKKKRLGIKPKEAKVGAGHSDLCGASSDGEARSGSMLVLDCFKTVAWGTGQVQASLGHRGGCCPCPFLPCSLGSPRPAPIVHLAHTLRCAGARPGHPQCLLPPCQGGADRLDKHA